MIVRYIPIEDDLARLVGMEKLYSNAKAFFLATTDLFLFLQCF